LRRIIHGLDPLARLGRQVGTATTGIVHAMLLRIQALLPLIKSLVLSGH
jgi:hypothetical protein